jgi:integrase
MPVHQDKKTRRYRIQFDFKGQSYYRRLPDGTTRETAEQLEIKWRHDLLFESFGLEKKRDVSLKQFVLQNFMPFAVGHYSAEGYKNVKVICRAFIQTVGGDKSLRSITAADIEKFKYRRLALPTKHKRQRQPSTVDRELNVVSKIFTVAVRAEMLEYNPCSRIERPRYDNLQNKIIPAAKIEKFLASFHTVWARDVAILILNTGLRQKDALGLTKFEVDFDNRVIRKTQGKSRRQVVIPMNDVCFALLSSRRSNGSELFFPSPRTGRQATSIKKSLLAAAESAGLGRVGTRVLRRSVATFLAEQNFNPAAIAKFLGHSDLRSIHRYGRETAILKDAADSLSESNPCKILSATTRKGR